MLTNIAGAISECVKLPHNHETLLKAGGIPAIVNLLNYTNEDLLENVTKIVAQCAVHSECMQQIVENDGIRLLWSLLRSSSTKVQASAAWALVPCIQNAQVMNYRYIFITLNQRSKAHISVGGIKENAVGRCVL